MRSRENRRFTVEECRVLEIGPLVRAGLLYLPVGTPWTITWPEKVGCEHIGLEGALFRWSEGEWSLVLRHSFTNSSLPEPLELPFTIRITRTACHYGNWRHWWMCPRVKEGHICRRRVEKLYLPPNSSFFACRQCHDLSYRSVQQHDSRVDKLVKNPFLLPWALTSPKRSRMFLGLKAYAKLVQRLNRKHSRTQRLCGVAADPFGHGQVKVV